MKRLAALILVSATSMVLSSCSWLVPGPDPKAQEAYWEKYYREPPPVDLELECFGTVVGRRNELRVYDVSAEMKAVLLDSVCDSAMTVCPVSVTWAEQAEPAVEGAAVLPIPRVSLLSGVYFLRFEAGDSSWTKKFVVLR